MRIVNASGIVTAPCIPRDFPPVSVGYNPELTGMEEKFSNIWHAWHNYLVVWTRDRAPKLLVILVLAFILVRLLGLITRKIVALSEKTPAHGAVRSQQVRTVVGVVSSVGVFLIVFIAGMTLLKDVFLINIEPLLASAGIAGLAIGFGAQTLVKDVINGFFILVEDQFEVGDTIRAAGVSGAVEEITMRRTILRDSDGTLHIVPNSSIQIVSNTTRDWSQVTLHVSADYSENSDRVVELLTEVAKEIYNDPAFKDDVVAEPQVPGIERVRGQEVDYLMLAKVRPGKQYNVARELRRRIKVCFEKNNIKAGAPVQIYTGQLPGEDKK
jgi:small conductance mechanosensitive channel